MISSQLIPGLRLSEVVRTVVAGIKAFQKTIGKGLLRTFLREDKQHGVKHKAEIMGRKVGHLRQGPWRCSLNARGLDTCTSCLMSYSPTYIDNTVKALWLNHWHHGLNSYVYFNVLIILNGNWITVDFSLLLMGTSCFVWTLGWGQGLSPQGAGIIQKVLSENMLQQTEGKQRRACYCGGEQWHNLIDCGFLWVPWLLLNNPECDRLASRTALVQTGHSSGPNLLVQGYSEGFSVTSHFEWAGADESEPTASSPAVCAECPRYSAPEPLELCAGS